MPHFRSSNVEPDDVKTYEGNGVVKVRADGFGISLGTEQHIERMNWPILGFGKGTKVMNIELPEWQVRYLFEAMRALEEQWRDTAAHSDEDTAADLGNDMMAFTAVHDHVERKAVKAFGPTVIEFQAVTPATPLNGEQPRSR
jgi:hypothetical protein